MLQRYDKHTYAAHVGTPLLNVIFDVNILNNHFK